MKKVLILADGIVAKHFLERVVGTFVSENVYHVVYYDDKIIPDIKSANVKFFKFDPTSFLKLSNILKDDYAQAIIVMANKADAEEVYKNIRMISRQLQLVLLDSWGLGIKDPNLFVVDRNEFLASRLIDYLPNIPVIAKNVGLGIGEIMEVWVHIGSPFVFRHIGTIEQNQWRIAALYRNNSLILPTSSMMILPNDKLLLVGRPSVLKNVYRFIMGGTGQFPIPYGSNLYLLIDMERQNGQIEKLLQDAVFLHQKLQDRKLIIRVVNPIDLSKLRTIKSFDCGDISVEVDYSNCGICEDLVAKECKSQGVGLIITSASLFSVSAYRQLFYRTKIPVLAVGQADMGSVGEGIVVLGESMNLEKISSAIFDISLQLGLALTLYDFDPDEASKEDIIEHFQNLAQIFSKKIDIVSITKNPIRELSKKENFLYFLPFSKKVLNRPVFSILSTDTQTLYFKLNRYHQLFIPVDI